jgi:hypothetical protein
MLGFFAVFLVAQIVTGMRSDNQDRREHGEATVGYGEYLRSGHFVEATFENWESEYLQMAAYVLFTALLFQRGSAESNDPDKQKSTGEDPRLHRGDPDAPWPVRRGGIVLKIYEHSLSLSLFLLFLLSFALHAWGGAREYSQEQLAHGGAAVSTGEFLRTSGFWFQSFQNWQSEFLAVASLAGLSVFLRERGSPESKPVVASHDKTGDS